MPIYSALTVVTPPAVEPVTLATAKAHLRVDNNDDDTLIATYLTAARNWAEEYLGRTLITQQLQYVIQPQPFTGAFPYLALPFPVAIYPLWYPWPDAMNYPTELPRAPVQSVDAISYGVWGSPDVVIAADQYQADLNFGRIQFTPGAAPPSSDHLAITFTAGYGADGSAVPGAIIAGILMLLSAMYENRGDVPGEPPATARMLLAMYRRVSFGGGST